MKAWVAVLVILNVRIVWIFANNTKLVKLSWDQMLHQDFQLQV